MDLSLQTSAAYLHEVSDHTLFQQMQHKIMMSASRPVNDLADEPLSGQFISAFIHLCVVLITSLLVAAHTLLSCSLWTGHCLFLYHSRHMRDKSGISNQIFQPETHGLVYENSASLFSLDVTCRGRVLLLRCLTGTRQSQVDLAAVNNSQFLVSKRCRSQITITAQGS